jgi:hypothetical protein
VEDGRPKKQAPAPEDVDLEVEGLEDVEDEDVLGAADELKDDDAGTKKRRDSTEQKNTTSGAAG